jgi:hypothetical protein
MDVARRRVERNEIEEFQIEEGAAILKISLALEFCVEKRLLPWRSFLVNHDCLNPIVDLYRKRQETAVVSRESFDCLRLKVFFAGVLAMQSHFRTGLYFRFGSFQDVGAVCASTPLKCGTVSFGRACHHDYFIADHEARKQAYAEVTEKVGFW